MKRPGFFQKYRGELLCLFLPGLLALVWNLAHHAFVELGPDARLYFSVAENFVSTGHFIQTSRAAENFVVPFGLPLILTLLRCIGLPLGAVVGLQYLLPGLSCLFLYKAERCLFRWGFFAPVFFCVALVRLDLNVNNIYVEHYFLPVMAWMLYTSLREDISLEKRVTLLLVGGFLGFFIRPMLAPVLVFVLGYAVFCIVRKRYSLRRLALLLLCASVILGANAWVNHRETGYWIVTDSYSGSDIYLANNECSPPEYYNSGKFYDFMGEDYYAFREQYPDADTYEESRALKAAALKWMREEPGTFLRNTAIKFRENFVWIWRYVLVVCFVSALIFPVLRPRYRAWGILTLVLNLVLGVVISMGIIMGRYTIPVWPLASLHLAYPAHEAFRFLGKLLKKQPKSLKQ